MAATIAAVSQSPCCWSSTTAAKPSRAIVSAATGEASVHQDEKTVSPARQALASAKAGTSAALLGLRDRLIEQFAHFRADLLFGNALTLQILNNFTQNVVIAAFLEIGEYHFLRVSLSLGARFAKLACGPQP